MDAGEEAPAAGRPAPLLQVLPQGQVHRRTVEQIVGPVPVVPMLHVFVPQMAEQLVEAPTIVSLVHIFEQTVDIPGRAGGRGVTGGL